MKYLALLTLLMFPASALAGGFEWSDDLKVAPSIGYAKNNGSKSGVPQVAGGVFVGTLMEKRVGDRKQVGLLGFVLMGATPVGEGLDVAYSVVGCPITFFDDMIQPCYGYNFTDATGMLYVGASMDF